MWKVVNVRNDAALRAFEAGVVAPMWTEIVAAQASGGSVAASVGGTHPALAQALLIRRDGTSLADVCGDLARMGNQTVQDEYQTYLRQNAQLRAGTTPQPSSVLRVAVTIFSGYLYERAFADAKVWSHLNPDSFTRALFHDNFRRDNPHVAACPYCDLDTVNAAANSSVEHFLPRSKYPYLALNAQNLIPSCTACNTSWQGKGTKVIQGAASPFQEDVGAEIEFSFDLRGATIGMAAKNASSSISGYIELIGIAPRYAATHIYQSVAKAGAALFETFARGKFSETDAAEYVARTRAAAPLTRVITSYVQQFGPYLGGKA